VKTDSTELRNRIRRWTDFYNRPGNFVKLKLVSLVKFFVLRKCVIQDDTGLPWKITCLR
jgi:hypothetical protein